MRISCSRCQAQYNLPDEKLERGAAKIRCKQCGHVFVVKRRVDESPPLPPEPKFEDFDFSAPPGPASSEPPAGQAESGFDSSLFDSPKASDSDMPSPSASEEGGASEEVEFGAFDAPLTSTPEPFPAVPKPAFDDFDMGALNLRDSEEKPSDLKEEGTAFGSLDPSALDLSDFSAPIPGTSEKDLTFADYGFSDAPKSGPASNALEPSVPSEASFDDFQFGSFEEPNEKKPPKEPERSAKKEETDDFFSSPDELPSLGELDLGEFDDGGGSFGFEEPAKGSRGREPVSEPSERVRREDLVSAVPSTREVPLQGLADDLPRLDLQKGPRRAEAGSRPSPLVARDRRRSPLAWVVLAAVLATAGYTGYNFYRHPEALTFLDPHRVRELWRNRDVEARFVSEDVKGYGVDVPGRRIFVIRGRVVNNSGASQGLIRVKGNLFGRDGGTLATSEVYCGNSLNERELAVLPWATIEARLQNQVGEALSNVDIAPGAKVPFMLVFRSPSGKVENFNVLVSAWRGGGTSSP